MPEFSVFDLSQVIDSASRMKQLQLQQQELELKSQQSQASGQLGALKLASQLQDLQNKQLEQQVKQQSLQDKRAAAIQEVIQNVPSIYKSQGIGAVQELIRTRIPGGDAEEGPDGKGLNISLGEGRNFLVDPKKQLSGKELIDTELKIRSDFSKATGDGHEALLAFDTIEKLAKNKSAGGLTDIALTYLLVRGLDPGGRVTDREIELPGSATGLKGRVIRTFLNVQKGRKLTDEQRKEFVELARAQKSVVQGQLAPVIENYKRISDDYGLNSANIIQPRGVVFSGTSLLQTPPEVQQALGLLNAPDSRDRRFAVEQSIKAGNRGSGEVKSSLNAGPVPTGARPKATQTAKPRKSFQEKLSQDLFNLGD